MNTPQAQVVTENLEMEPRKSSNRDNLRKSTQTTSNAVDANRLSRVGSDRESRKINKSYSANY